MIRIKITSVFIFCIACFISSIKAQVLDYNYFKFSKPFTTYYSPKEYKSENTNWSILQDKRGLMYFGNEKGILEYDGNSWRKIEVPNSALVRSLAMDDNGIIYVCASNNFGYLESDPSGQLKYKSLVGFLDAKYKNFGEIWDVVSNSKGVYFKTDDKIFRFNGGKISVIEAVNSFRFYKIEDDIYSRNYGVGLMKIDGDSIFIMPGGEYFAETGVFDMLPYNIKHSNNFKSESKRILVTTNYRGLYLHDGNKFFPFKTEVDSFLINSQIYNATLTEDGNYAFATQRGGVIIIDTKGKLIKVVNDKNGLPSNVVYDVLNDKHGGLWIATAKGIVYCKYPSSFSIIPDKDLIKDQITSLLRFNDILYATNSFGVLYFDEITSSFKLIEGSNKPGMHLLNFNGDLIAATNWGVGKIEKNAFQKFLIDNSSNILLHSKYYPDRIYVGHRKGLLVLQQQKHNHNFDVYDIGSSEEEIFSIVEDSNNSLWLLSDFGVLIHITDGLNELSSQMNEKIKFDRYTNENGLPKNCRSLYNINGKMFITSNKGVYSFNKETKGFVRDSIFGGIFLESTNNILLIEKNKKGDLWILAEVDGSFEFGKATLDKNGQYLWQPIPGFRRLDLENVQTLYVDYEPKTNKEILWFSTDEGLVRYEPNVYNNFQLKYPALIRRVIVNNDSLIYGGGPQIKSSIKEVILPFSDNDIHFEFSLTSYDKPEDNLFQYFLEGVDDNWSNWVSDTKRDYTNLSGGEYKFRVRAKNIYGVLSEEAVYNFKILPPLYLTWWAYVIYAIMLLIVIYFADRFMRGIIIKKERARAKLREAELIKKQAEELEIVDRLVRVINNAADLEQLFKSLLEHTIKFIPQAEKAAIFLLDHKINKFYVAFTSGYQVNDLDKISFSPQELQKRYTEKSKEIEKGIYIIDHTDILFGDEKFSGFNKPKSMLVMAVEWDRQLEAYVVFDSFADRNAFTLSTARILNKFREHAVSAISKAQSLKTLHEKNEEIIRTQEQLVTQQKLASLGALTAGIAHEIKNPLNFVNNFSEMSQELIDELKVEFKNNNKEEVLEIAETLKQNLKKINQHGKRADSIVKGMLLHSRGTSGEKVLTNINDLLDQYVMLAYHGVRAQNKEFNITIEKDYDSSLEKINVVPQDISRVFLNLVNNACYAANEKKQKSGNEFAPLLSVSTKNLQDKVEIRIRDNGNGIPAEIRDKLFNPFFTTKPTGEGTGLGLSLSYDIVVKQHSGEIKFESEEGEYTEFIIALLKNNLLKHEKEI